jgi:hypothetical protein
LDSDDFDQIALAPKIDALVRQAQLPKDVAADFKKLLSEGEVDFALDSDSIILLVSQLAATAPEVAFAVRGMGEEPRTVWVREYEKGKESFAFGPPEGAGF